MSGPAVPPSSAGATIPCPQCKAKLPPDATFCLKCGNRLPAKAAPPRAVPPRARPQGATLLGLSLEKAPPPAPAPPIPAPPAAPSSEPPGGPKALKSTNKTMLGLSVAELPSAPVSPPPAPSGPGTLHGVAPGALAAKVPAGPAPTTGSTMMGVPALGDGAGAPQSPPTLNAGPFVSPQARARKEGPPMMGGPVPGVPPATFPPGGAADPGVPGNIAPSPTTPAMYAPVGGPAAVNDDSLDIEIPGLPSRRRKGPGVGLFVGLGLVGLLVLGGLVVLGLKLRGSQAPTLQAEWRPDASGGIVLALTVPGVGSGARVRAGGREFPIDAAGRVELTVPDPSGQVGGIDQPVEVVRPGGEAHRYLVHYLIGYRLAPNLSHLGDDPPVVHLDFRVPVGSQLFVAEQPIQVVGDRGIAAIPGPEPLRAGAEGGRREVYPIRVRTPDGQTIERPYELRLPRAPLRVDAPAAVSLASGAQVEVRGRCPGASRVRVGSLNAPLTGDTFQVTVPVQPGRNALDVVAHGPNTAPALAPVVVYRDVSPQTFLAGVGSGSALLATRPPPGRRLRFTGRVLAPAPGEVRSFQVLVPERACTGGNCTVWVDPVAGLELAVGGTYDLVGETVGQRAYTTQSGERRTDPVVAALFATPRR
ncbi:MAG: hypothetical protein HY909_05960 [Deltaproteobacteria bacterium]|nr:hypothetical protein [Deltaproteobacteria bacterium]